MKPATRQILSSTRSDQPEVEAWEAREDGASRHHKRVQGLLMISDARLIAMQDINAARGARLPVSRAPQRGDEDRDLRSGRCIGKKSARAMPPRLPGTPALPDDGPGTRRPTEGTAQARSGRPRLYRGRDRARNRSIEVKPCISVELVV